MRTGDCGFCDCRLRIEIFDCGLGQQSTIHNLNQQSTISKSTVINLQSAFSLYPDNHPTTLDRVPTGDDHAD